MKQYKVVFNIEGTPFDELVSDHLNEGWELHGNPWTHQEGEGENVHLYQALQRTVEYVIVEEDLEDAELTEEDSAE